MNNLPGADEAAPKTGISGIVFNILTSFFFYCKCFFVFGMNVYTCSYPPVPEPENMTQPALIILGKDDPIFPISLAEDYQKALPEAKMIVYENCGHAVLLEKADQLSRDMREFLKGT